MIQSSSPPGETPLHVVLEVADHDALMSVLETVSELDTAVRTQNISQANLSRETTVNIDLALLTEKQRETLELALSKGYYERPRETDLTALADHLKISKSAVSQRIRNAETKLIKSALEQYE